LLAPGKFFIKTFFFFFRRKTSPGSEKKLHFEKFAGHLQYSIQYNTIQTKMTYLCSEECEHILKVDGRLSRLMREGLRRRHVRQCVRRRGRTGARRGLPRRGGLRRNQVRRARGVAQVVLRWAGGMRRSRTVAAIRDDTRITAVRTVVVGRRTLRQRNLDLRHHVDGHNRRGRGIRHIVGATSVWHVRDNGGLVD
jgi:hypothetical protein